MWTPGLSVKLQAEWALTSSMHLQGITCVMLPV